MARGKQSEQEIVEKLARVLDISYEEALEVRKFDKETEQASMKNIKEEEKKLPVNQQKEEEKVEKKVYKKGELTDNQKLVIAILQEEKGHMFTAKEISEVSKGVLNSRGLGAVMKKLIEKEMVSKIHGTPVRYQWIEKTE